jgi:hypothetical protein
MKNVCKIVGLEEVVANLNREMSAIEGACLRGLVNAGIEIKRDAQKLTPVVVGNLRNSAYVTSPKRVEAGVSPDFKDGDKPGLAVRLAAEHAASVASSVLECRSTTRPEVHVGYSAYYAPWVHENPRAGATGGRSPAGYKYREGTYSVVGQCKFLQAAIENNVAKILSIVATYASKKLRGRNRG